jgi:ADP-ribose pyrophosphatase YjhB (NUDIX family)
MFSERVSVIYYLLTRGYIPGVLTVVYRKTRGQLEFLLVKSKVSKAVTFPSGSLLIGEGEQQSAARELLEETGIKLANLVRIPLQHEFTYKLPIRLKSIQKIFIAEANNNKHEKPERSTDWARWIRAKEVRRKLTHKELRQTFNLVMEYIKRRRKI